MEIYGDLLDDPTLVGRCEGHRFSDAHGYEEGTRSVGRCVEC